MTDKTRAVYLKAGDRFRRVQDWNRVWYVAVEDAGRAVMAGTLAGRRMVVPVRVRSAGREQTITLDAMERVIVEETRPCADGKGATCEQRRV